MEKKCIIYFKGATATDNITTKLVKGGYRGDRSVLKNTNEDKKERNGKIDKVI